MDDNTAEKILTMLPLLNEKQRRIYLASEAIALGRGGIAEISRISGVSRSMISAGIREIRSGDPDLLALDAPQRRKGAGRKPLTQTQPGILEALESLLSGDPEGPLRWTSRSLRSLAEELQGKGFSISYRKVGYLLEDMGYSLRGSQRADPQSDAAFRHICDEAVKFMREGCPVIHVECKGTEDGAAVQIIRCWWEEIGRKRYPSAESLLLTADERILPVLERELRQMGIEITFCPFPPGTYRWKEVEERLESRITRSREGYPEKTLEATVSLIAPGSFF